MLTPTFESIVEAERRVLAHFQWEINFVLPLTFVRILLAQGILFTSELTMYEEKLAPVDYKQLKQELSKALTTEALTLSDIVMAKSAACLRLADPSEIAASIILYARKNVLFSKEVSKMVVVPKIWPDELSSVTRCSR